MLLNIVFAKIRRVVRSSPFLYFFVLGWRKNVKRLRAREGTEVVIEGFPRSANTSSVYVYSYAQKRSVKVGHHLHVIAHVKYAIKRNIPCMVIVRRPLDCVSSLMVMQKGGDPKALLLDYISFYKPVLKYSDRLVVISFDKILGCGIGSAVEVLNSRFGTDFSVPKGSGSERDWSVKKIVEWNRVHGGSDPEKLSIPNDKKREKAEKIKKIIEAECKDLLNEANCLYGSLDPHFV
tara:strand:+ start:8940 stop:9644 length:705 start_codon:yes stop_codon:yes gene_type:complete